MNNPATKWLNALLASLPKKQSISSNQFSLLQQAQNHLWQALNIYDDIQDGDCGPEKLWVANRHWRNFFTILYQLNLSPSFYRLSKQLFSRLEESNEKEYCSKKACSKRRLADKSLPLCLGPLAALEITRGENLAERRSVLALFRYALAAKQLSDDCRDWQEDWRAKRLTLANHQLNSIKTRLQLKTPDEEIKANLLFFCHSSNLTKIILQQLEKARCEGLKLGLGENSPLIRCLIIPLKKSAQEAQNWQKIFSGRKTAAML